MADDAGSEPAGSSEDALSESCVSSEATGTHSGVDDLPSSPPSAPFDAAQDLLLSDKSEKVDLDETSRTEESSEFNHEEEEDEEEEPAGKTEKNVLDINRFNHQPDRLSSPIQTSDSSSSDTSFDSTLDSSRSELSAEILQISNESLFHRSQEKPNSEGTFSIPLNEEDSSKEDSFIIPQSEEEFSEKYNSSPPRKDEDNAEVGNLLLSEDEEEPKKEFDFTAPLNYEKSKNGDNYTFPQNEEEFEKEDNFTTPQSEEQSKAKDDSTTPLNDEEPMEEDTLTIPPSEKKFKKEDNFTTPQSEEESKTEDNSKTPLNDEEPAEEDMLTIPPSEEGSKKEDNLTSLNNEELLKEDNFSISGYDRKSKEQDNDTIPENDQECKKENNFSIPKSEKESMEEDSCSIFGNDEKTKEEINFSIPVNNKECMEENNFSIPQNDREFMEENNFSIPVNDKECMEENNFSIPENDREFMEENFSIPENEKESKEEDNSAIILKDKELEKQVYFTHSQIEEESKEENITSPQNIEESEEEDKVVAPLDDEETKIEDNFAIPLSNKQAKKKDFEKTKSLSVEKPPQMLKRILYSGYKKKETTCRVLKPERRINNRGNPFNPSWKKDSNISHVDAQNRHVINLTASPDSNYQDCTHYLGLQPSINFRCNHCGMSGFESIQLLNLHQSECRKVLGHSTSTNIKITRKVYLCSACGTYYESWHLFYHMRKVHDKFMCLYCLGMFTYSEKLCEHLTTKHQVNFINFPDIESFKKCNLSSYLFLCLECDNVMSDSENFKHTCTPQKPVPKIVLKQPVQNPTVPCVVVEPSPKRIQDSPKNSTSKNNLTEESPAADPSTFCHVDIKSPEKDSLAPPIIREPSPSPSPPPPPPPVREKEPTKVNSIFLSEFPRIDLQSSKSRDRDRDTSDRGSERMSDYEGGFDSGDEIRNISDTPKVEIRSESKSAKVKRVKRQRAGTGRQPKRPKLDPEKQRSALEKLTETIDAVAKNYTREPSLPPAPIPPPIENIEDLAKSIDPPITNHELPPMENSVAEEEMEGESPNKLISEIPDEETAVNGLPDKPPIWKSVPDKNLGKFKLRTDLESDEESDDSNKLSMVIDETPAHSDNDSRAAKISTKGVVNTSDDSNQDKEPLYENAVLEEQQPVFKPKDEIPLAGEDVPAMALTLDDKVQDVKVQHILKECVRTSCMSCNYCRRAIKIAVNGKFLALHLLSEHRYTPTKNDSPEDVINKLKSSLDELSNVYFNTESYDSSDPSIHVPYDKDNTFDCFQCSFVTHTHKDLHIHKRKSHTKSLLLCIMCKINFYSYSELLCHLCPGHYNPDYQFNNIDVTFRCCFCKLDTIPSAFRLMVHLRKCHHTCDICLEICSDQQKLSTHMWKHKLNHLCYRCGIAYASKLDITKHLFWKHGTESVLCKKCLQKKWPHVYHFCIPPTSFLCEECNSCFSKAVALKVHKRIHAGDFSYQCTQCEKKFVSKKLLQKHEDHHNNPVDPNEQDEKGKEEIIDVTGESTGNTDGTGAGDNQVEENENQKGSDKENESSKHHKKHKKDKKPKQVVDVYDLPPLNLSSESDSSDDESTKNNANDPEKDLKDSDSKNDDTPEDNNDNKDNTESVDLKEEVKTDTNNVPDSSLTDQHFSVTLEKQESEDPEKPVLLIETENFNEESTEPSDDKPLESFDEAKTPEHAVENTSIWENFYKTNSNNKNLPYPLCAMKSEDAYKIIMGDHDYCLQMKMSDPVINEDILQSNLECDKVDPVGSVVKPDLNETTASDSSPTKKKQKSPKKKSGNNSSSSSDSSSDSDSSSCSCGENCSCSSSSSDSSSSSSSDSDSSASEGGNKQKADKRKKKKEKKTKNKTVPNMDQNGENKTIVETVTPAVPEEPAVRESDLDTEESSTDEEFYDRQPQKQSNQLMAEKRNQLMLLASVAPAHGEGLGHELTKSSTLNEAFSDLSGTAPSTPDPSQHPTKKVNKNRRKKSFMMKSRKRVNKTIPTYTLNNTTQPADSAQMSPKPYVLKLKEPKRQETPPTFGSQTPPPFVRNTLTSDNNSGGGSESESVRASKRKRVPNKFYGYSSGEEEERLQQAKWKKPEVSTPPPPPPPPPVVTTPKFIHSTPQTPRIQLSVPKQIIRKNNTDPTKARHYVSGNDSTDSSSDNDKRFRQQHIPPPPPPQPLPSPPVTKQDKNLYCYCRCPYDEVSEMIACDDENCKIEWFHFECVGISVPPKGQWFCPQCSKKRGILP